MSTENTPAKRQKSAKDVPYRLVYWPGLPGRGELIRLILEQAGATYSDSALEEGCIDEVMKFTDAKHVGDSVNPPVLAPPFLEHGDLLLSQTPNILQYLATREGLAGNAETNPDAVYHVNELAMTALDGFSDEVHDCHHPIASGLYYEDQKDEALRRSQDYVKNRLPKFLTYFQRVLEGKASGEGPWLYGGQLTYADLVLFQAIDGTKYMFRKATENAEKSGKYKRVFALHAAVKEQQRIKEYLASDRRQKYGNGIYRYYEELDLE